MASEQRQVSVSQPQVVVPQGCTYDPKTGKIFRLCAPKLRAPAFQQLESQLAHAKLTLAKYMQERDYKYHVGTKQVLQGNTPVTVTPVHQALIDAVKTSQQAVKAYKHANSGEFAPQMVLPRRRRGKRSIGSVPIVEGSIPKTKVGAAAQSSSQGGLMSATAGLISGISQKISGSGHSYAQAAASATSSVQMADMQLKVANLETKIDQLIAGLGNLLSQSPDSGPAPSNLGNLFPSGRRRHWSSDDEQDVPVPMANTATSGD